MDVYLVPGIVIAIAVLLCVLKVKYWNTRHIRKWGACCTAQEGEDMVLRRYFAHRKKNGFYVDVGAHHPERFSTTKYYYDNGWNGINIDAAPGSMKVFHQRRPKDRNIEAAIGSSNSMLQFFMFKEPAVSTFDPTLVEERTKKYGEPKVAEVQMTTLASLLDKELPAGQTIDFLNIDAEGVDLAVLQSNNWEKYRPNLVLVESFGTRTVLDALKTEIYAFLKQNHYELVAKTANTMIYQDDRAV